MVSPSPHPLVRMQSFSQGAPKASVTLASPALPAFPARAGLLASSAHPRKAPSHSSHSSPRRRSVPFLEAIDSDDSNNNSPYLFDLDEELRPDASEGQSAPSMPPPREGELDFSLGLGLPDVSHLDAMLADLPPMYDPAVAMDEGAMQLSLGAGSGDLECERCWESGSRCADCTRRKQAQFALQAWPLEQQLVKQEGGAFLPDMWSDHKAEPQPLPLPLARPLSEEEKSSSTQLSPLSESLLPAHAVEPLHPSRLPGRLTRFLPEGTELAAVELVDPMLYHTQLEDSFEQEAQRAEQERERERFSRSMRARRPAARSRSSSPDLSDRSTTPDTFAVDSAYETDQYEPEEESSPHPHRPHKKQKTQQHAQTQQHVQPPLQRGDSLAGIKPGELADDTISPSALAGAGGSGESSAEPPQPTRLLPVSARDLLPSRPSTAQIPPAHIKDRLVRSAKKLLTAADGANENVQVAVIPLWYPSKGAAGAHKIRLIRVENTADRSVSVYAHAADVGGVVERKSNISRLFGKFDSPQEKMLMNVVGAHNHQVGQESNILTLRGVKKFLTTNKMKSETSYRDWITRQLLPKLQFDPLEVGDEEMEIEASTNPNQPTRVKPKKLKQKERKRKAEESVEPPQSASATPTPLSHSASATSAPLPPSPPPSKRQKLPPSPPFPAMHMPSFGMGAMQSDAASRHAA